MEMLVISARRGPPEPPAGRLLGDRRAARAPGPRPRPCSATEKTPLSLAFFAIHPQKIRIFRAFRRVRREKGPFGKDFPGIPAWDKGRSRRGAIAPTGSSLSVLTGRLAGMTAGLALVVWGLPLLTLLLLLELRLLLNPQLLLLLLLLELQLLLLLLLELQLLLLLLLELQLLLLLLLDLQLLLLLLLELQLLLLLLLELQLLLLLLLDLQLLLLLLLDLQLLLLLLLELQLLLLLLLKLQLLLFRQRVPLQLPVILNLRAGHYLLVLVQ